MKTICITGATDGLGKALALLLDQAGYNLILCGRNPQKLQNLQSQLSRNHFLSAFDITDKEACHQFFLDAYKTVDFIDVLINNAGANFKKARVESILEEDLLGMFELNCLSQVRCIQAVYPSMKAKQSGHIINILSSCCLYNNETMAGYSASKDAMQAISKTLCKEALEDHIKVTSFYPGGIDTNFRTIPNPTYLDPYNVALTLQQLIELPDELNVQEFVVRPQIEKNF